MEFSFNYLLDKIKNAEFNCHPFKHIYIEKGLKSKKKNKRVQLEAAKPKKTRKQNLENKRAPDLRPATKHG